ncbi:MAG: hypothetical protein FD170_3764 [Bacteroidetes bacterium]|nr:MAG: hypothetical protein FD170_3764 [Bacteroidota bacterium]
MANYGLTQVNKYLFLISLFLLTSCNKEPVKYYHIINGNQKTIIKGKVKNELEEGNWSIATEKGELLANGVYHAGLKIGLWTYYFNDTLINILWKKYENEKGIKINLPEDWIIIEHESELLQATFETQSKNKLNKYLLIGGYIPSEIGLTFEDYIKLSKQEVREKSSIVDEQSFVVHTDGKQYSFTRFIINRENEELVVYNYIGLIEGVIIDIGYSSLNENKEYKNLLFFEILIGCYYKGNRIINPLKVLNFESIN